MYVLRADTGATYDVNIALNANVELLKELLAPLASLPPADQILLCEGTKLEGRRTLESYGLPSKDKDVFLFNRRVLDFSASIPDEVVLGPVDVHFPQFKQPTPTKEEESAPLLFALKTYECQFLHHVHVAQAIHEAMEKRIAMCSNCFTEEHVQVRGIESAMVNLNDHMRQLVQSYSTLMSYTNQQRVTNEDLLRNFESDLAKLKDVPVHTALPIQQRTLLDYVPEIRLRKWAEECRNEHEQLKSRTVELEAQVKRLQEEVESENRRPPDADFKVLNERLVIAGEASKDILVRLQMFVKDHENVRARVDEALRHVSHNQPMWGLCDGFDDIRKVHESQLAMLHIREHETRDLLVVFSKSKTLLTRSVYTRLRAVSSFQSRIRDVSNTVVAMGEAVSRLRTAFTQLSIVKNMPQAYQGSVQEIIRRRGFGRKIRREVSRFAELIAGLRDKELPKRDAFHAYFRFLPKELVAATGLADPLPQFELSLPPFDTKLPNIESASSGEEEDFALVPFPDDQSLPKMQPFERENAIFNQSSGSRDIKTLNTGTSGYNVSSGSPGTVLPVGSPSSVNVDVIKLQRELASAKEATTSYVDRIKTLEVKLNSTYTQATTAEESLRQYKEKYEVVTNKLEELTKVPKPTDQKAVIVAEIEALKVQLMQNEEALRQKDKAISGYELNMKVLTSDVASTQTALERARDVISSLEASDSFLKSQVADLENKLKISQSTIQALNKDLAQAQDKLLHHESSLNAASTSLTVLIREKDEENNKLVKAQEELEYKLKKATEDKQVTENSLQKILQDFESSNKAHTEELKAKDATVEALEKEIYERVRQLKEQCAEAERELQKQKQGNDVLQASLGAEKKNSLVISELKGNFSNLENELQNVRLSKEELQRRVGELSTSVTEKDRIAASLQSDLENLQLNVARKEGTIMAQEEQLTSLQDALQQSFSRSTYLETEVSSLQTSLTASVHSVEQSYIPKSEYDAVSQKLAKKESELQETTNQVTNYSKKSLEANKIISSLEKRIQEIEEDKKKAAQQFERQLANYRQLEEEYTKTKKSLLEISNTLQRYDVSPLNERDQGDVTKFQKRILKVLEAFDDSKAELASIYAKNIDIDSQLSQLHKANTALEQNLLVKGQENEDLQRNISDMQNFMAALEISQADRTSDRISLRSFVHGDLALFTRNAQGFYEALNIASPNYYLSEYSISLLEDKKSPQPLIYGQIVELDKGKADTVHNPYKLPLGTEYHEVTITKVN